MKTTKRALFSSVVALILCFSMLVSTTFAWFTDEVKSGMNQIVAGSLDVELLADGEPVKNDTMLFDDVKYWEPGAVVYENLTVQNAGNLALKWQMSLNFGHENHIDGHKLSDVLQIAIIDTIAEGTSRESVLNVAAPKATSLSEFYKNGELPGGESESFAVVIFWLPGENDNIYNLNNGKTTSDNKPLHIEFGVKLQATQMTGDMDSFGDDYDAGVDFPAFEGITLTADVTGKVDEDNKLTEDVTLTNGQAMMRMPPSNVLHAVVKAGTQLKPGTTKLTMTIAEMEATGSNIILGEGEQMRSLDVHLDGVAGENTTPILVCLPEIAPTGLNLGNYKFYHVEANGTNEMTLVATPAAHNDFSYDPATGDVVLAMATFSEVAIVAEEAKWKGNFDYSWYTNAVAPADGEAVTEYVIANADQLAAFGAIVGGMAKDKDGNFLISYTDSDGDEHHNDFFKDKTVKLLADINLGDVEADNNPNLIFYPIGYWNSEGTYEKTGTAISSGFYAFKGTFDGNGNTISNFYQNTWEMKGDHDWYDATLQYYRDGMGLFGRILGGTVKNLTVDNFSCDSEIGTSGVIAAYADSMDGKPATFENITITNCNPRVYNIGNGGIVGCAGWYSRNNSLGNDDYTNAVTFKNITVDQTNKISALWGSWGVSCAGILGQYYPNSKCGIKLENCHVAAVIDVNNDVCSNYQYYWYRYAGMFIGTIRANTKDTNGYEIADTTGVFAKDCTYTMGNWNEYWYCEIVANSLASYTHDHQFSRLDNITDISEIKNADGTWKKEGHFALLSADRKSVECYHIFKNSNGELYQHFHDVADESNPNIYESFDLDGNGQLDDLKEDRQRYFIPFNQLLTGLDMGIKAHTAFEGITEKKDGTVESKKKFESIGVTNIDENATVTLDKLFTSNVDQSVISMPTVQVYVSPMGYGSTVSAKYNQDVKDWTQSTLEFSGKGSAKIVITDYFYCTSTTMYVTVGGVVTSYDKFETKFTGDFLYRVGNENAVELGYLFGAKNGAQIGTVDVIITNDSGTASGAYTSNATWTKGTVKFSGTGKVKVTITDNDYCTPTELYLEVVDAVNATGAMSATANNVVLLNDAGFGSLEVKNGYTLYGNGFTLTCGSDSAALNTGYEFVALNNGTLDNVQIVCPNFDHAVLYSSNMTSSDNRSHTDEKGTTRYYNVKSAVEVNGNSQILNSRISGGRAAVNIVGGNCVIDNSRIEGGAVANILVGAANSVTLRDVTLVQKPTVSTHDSSKTLMGFSVLVVCDANGDSAPITLEGELIQNAWVNENYKKYVPSSGQSIVAKALNKTDFLHDIDGDGTKESLNLGFAYMPESTSGPVNSTTISDNRGNKDLIPYGIEKISLGLTTSNTYVYSYKNTNGTNDAIKTESEYIPNKYSDIITVTYSDTADGLTTGKTFGTDGWVYELNVDLDKLSGYALDFSKLSMTVNGVAVTDYKVNGAAKPSSVAVTSGGVTYTLTATVNGKECTATFKVTGTETSKESPSKISGPTTAGFGVAKSYGGDWSGAADVLTGVKVKYWSVAENKYIEFDFSNFNVPGNAGKLNGTNNYWEYTHTNNDFTLKVTNTVAIHSGKSVYGMPICGTDGKLYFTISSTNGYVGSGTTSRSITMQYEFTDNNGGEKLTFTHTFAISYSKDEQYSYSDLSGSGKLTKLESNSGGGPCFTPDTLVTLADGSQKRVDELQLTDKILAWDFFTGSYVEKNISLLVNHGASLNDVIYTSYSDGTLLKLVGEHGVFDYDLNKFVYITANNVTDFIGHRFVKQNLNGGYDIVTMTDGYVKCEYVEAWSVSSAVTSNAFASGLLTVAPPEDFYNWIEMDDKLHYDVEQFQKDVQTYGLYTYEDFKDYVTYEQFIDWNGAYLKIPVEKGYFTFEYILELIEMYKGWMPNN